MNVSSAKISTEDLNDAADSRFQFFHKFHLILATTKSKTNALYCMDQGKILKVSAKI